MKNMLSIVFTAVMLMTMSFAAHGQPEQYDIVILNGRVMDPETMLDATRNVGIKDGVIATITEKAISGKDTIDASGHVVAPGFIDMHSHTVNLPFGQKLHLRDGVTTPLDLESGAWPVDVFYDSFNGKAQTNYGATVSVAGIRETLSNPDYDTDTGSILTDLFDPNSESMVNMTVASWLPTADQIEEMRDMIETGFQQGALGIGAPVGYMTEGATSQETIMWQEMVAKYGLSTILHGRFSSEKPPATGILGTQEMVSSLAVHGGGLYVSHIHQQALDLTPVALDFVESASNKGMNIVAAIYPYWQGATIVGADYLKPANYQRNMGRSYEDIIDVSSMKPLTKESYEELIESNPGTSVIFGGISEEMMLSALADPQTVVESDSAPLSISATGALARDWDTSYDDVQGHPRASGTHAKVLRLVREKELMPLMLAISKMSYMLASFLEENGVSAMARKGRMQEGKDADITIFDPDTVTDNATMAKGGLPSTGIPYVIVNGTIVVSDSRVLKDVYPGRPIRNDLATGIQ